MREQPPEPDYFDALAVKGRTAILQLAAGRRRVPRARFGRHYQLLDVLMGEADEVEKVINYIELAAGEKIANEVLAEEIPATFDSLAAINEPVQAPAIVRFQTQGGQKLPGGLRYKGRFLAWAVAEIAGAFGWTADYVLNELGPEEALLYLQEIAYAQHQDHAFAYSLSTVGRDKRGTQKAFPQLPWLSVPYKRETMRISKAAAEKYLPIGTMVDIEAIAASLEEQRRGR